MELYSMIVITPVIVTFDGALLTEGIKNIHSEHNLVPYHSLPMHTLDDSLIRGIDKEKLA